MRLPRITLVAAACMALAPAAHATLITFDELPWRPVVDFSDYPVTTQYAAQGVTFNIGYLMQTDADPPAHPNRYLLGSHEMTVTFSGSLPNYVSFNLSSPYGESSESYAYAVDASNSLVGRGRTGGYYPDGSQEPPWQQDMPYQANRHISFYSASGIAYLNFNDAYGSRLSSTIDNLYFGSVPAVPEPATLALWAAGIGVFALARRRGREGGVPRTALQL